MLLVENVTRRFGGSVAVDDVSFRVAEGGITGLIGPNGAGKTTMFNLIAGSLAPSAGRILLRGRPIQHEPAHRRAVRGIGRSFQIPKPFAAMSVLENLLVGAQGQLGEALWRNFLPMRAIARQERELRAQAREILAFLALSPLAEAPAGRLSGGQRKLLELGRVLMARPSLVLLDEPAAGVNPSLLEVIIDRIRDLNASGISFLIVEHNMDLVTRLCGQVHVMAGGRLLASGPPAAVTRNPAVVDAYLGGAA